MSARQGDSILIVGAGPAGLAAAHEAAKRGLAPVVLEKRAKPGGLACTEEYRGFLFDMGGHRFFSKDPSIVELWRRMLPEDFLRRPRLSRIYYRGKLFDYPLRPLNALAAMGPLEGMSVIGSYLRWRLLPHRPEDTFERWVTNRFGRRLYEMFFRSYTEKVWGIPCSRISAEWAAQRIRNLSLGRALAGMLPSFNGNRVRSLIHEFDYPRKGPGMMWDAMVRAIEGAGGDVRYRQDVTSIRREGSRIREVVATSDGLEQRLAVDQLISSMPITSLVRILTPPPPREVLEAAARLRYRDFVTVCLLVRRPDVFPDQWIYVHDPGVRMGRIQNFKNWSPEMVPDPGMTGLGLEYFCNAGDDLWSLGDDELVALGKRELGRMGLVNEADVVDGAVYRVPKAYPVYDDGYGENLELVRGFVRTLGNLQTIGRNGLFRYNNMDHSMLTGLLAVGNLTREADLDLWHVNEEQEYLESARG